MCSRVDRALRAHPIVPCPVWYRQRMLEPPPGPAHDESASNRRTHMIPSAAVTRQSRIHFGMVRVCIHPGHLHPRPPPPYLICRGSRQRPNSNPRVLDGSWLLTHRGDAKSNVRQSHPDRSWSRERPKSPGCRQETLTSGYARQATRVHFLVRRCSFEREIQSSGQPGGGSAMSGYRNRISVLPIKRPRTAPPIANAGISTSARTEIRNE
jgi:hypothetical protein